MYDIVCLYSSFISQGGTCFVGDVVRERERGQDLLRVAQSAETNGAKGLHQSCALSD